MPVPETREHKTDFDENLEQYRIPIHRTTRSQTKGEFKSAPLDERRLKKEWREFQKKEAKEFNSTDPKQTEEADKGYKAKIKENLRKLKLDLLNQDFAAQNAYINWKNYTSKIPFGQKKKRKKKKRRESSSSSESSEEEKDERRSSASSETLMDDGEWFLPHEDPDRSPTQPGPPSRRTRSSTKAPDIFPYPSPARGREPRYFDAREEPEPGPLGLSKYGKRSRASSAEPSPRRRSRASSADSSPRRSSRLAARTEDERRRESEAYKKGLARWMTIDAELDDYILSLPKDTPEKKKKKDEKKEDPSPSRIKRLAKKLRLDKDKDKDKSKEDDGKGKGKGKKSDPK